MFLPTEVNWFQNNQTIVIHLTVNKWVRRFQDKFEMWHNYILENWLQSKWVFKYYKDKFKIRQLNYMISFL